MRLRLGFPAGFWPRFCNRRTDPVFPRPLAARGAQQWRPVVVPGFGFFALAEFPDNFEGKESWIPLHLRSQRDRYPHFHRTRKLEVFGGYPHDGVALSVENYLATQHSGSCGKTPSPRRVGEDRHMIVVGG